MGDLSHRGDEHSWIRENLPWHLNGTLPAADSSRLKAHLAVCVACRAGLAAERGLQRAIAVEQVVDYAPQASLAKLMQRIDAPPPLRWWRRLLLHAGLSGRTREPGRRSPILFVLVAQAAALAVLAVALSYLVLRPSSETAGIPAEYRSLSDTPPGPPAGPQLMLVFADDLSVAKLRDLLAVVGGRIVGGPGPSGMFRVALEAGGDPEDIAAKLRAMPGVRYVGVVQAMSPP